MNKQELPEQNNPVKDKTGPQPPDCPLRISVKIIEKDYFGGYDKITEKQFTDLNNAYMFYLRSPKDQFASTTIQLIHVL